MNVLGASVRKSSLYPSRPHTVYLADDVYPYNLGLKIHCTFERRIHKRGRKPAGASPLSPDDDAQVNVSNRIIISLLERIFLKKKFIFRAISHSSIRS